MSRDSDTDPHADQSWQDLYLLIGRSHEMEVEAAGPHTLRAMVNMLAVNMNAGHAADRLVGMGFGNATQHDIAGMLTNVICSAFVALADYVPDVREYWEINLRELVVKTER